MIIGVPRELKQEEYRVSITPAGVRELTGRGHRVIIEEGAGSASSIADEDFKAVGAEIVPEPAEVFESADLILKVKELKPTELTLLRPNHLVFTFLHLAAYPDQAARLIESGATALAYETVELASGALPLLAPMSEIAGRMAAQAGAHYLERPQGGRGVLIGGISGVPPARVVVLGAGMAGTNAAMIAAGMGGEVRILDLNVDRLRRLDEMHWGRVVTVRSSVYAIEEHVPDSDLVIGAVLVPGARAPVVVGEELVAAMKPGSVVVDISVDQGGCVATTRETTHAEPVYEERGVIHYAVANIPGAVPNTATYALTNSTLPYVVALAEGLPAAVATYPELEAGINVAGGRVTNRAVAESLDRDFSPSADVLGL